jgi:hypothetical protein
VKPDFGAEASLGSKVGLHETCAGTGRIYYAHAGFRLGGVDRLLSTYTRAYFFIV